MKKKTIYLLLLLVVVLLGVIISPTYAKFTSGFTTEDDVVGIVLSFNLKMSNLEEYEEIVLEANSYEVFNVEITNATGADVYYGIWYKLVAASEQTDDVIVHRLEGTDITTSGSIVTSGSVTATIIVMNRSSSPVKINVGVGSSATSTSDIEYLGGKYLITGVSSIPYLSNYVQSLYNDGSSLTTVNIGGDSGNPTVTQNQVQSIMLDNNGEYRYYGANPNNYVRFNHELWRIISVSNVKSDEDDTTGSMRVKLIREASVGNYSWDSSASTVNTGYGVNDWSLADAMQVLNIPYYQSRVSTCYNDSSDASGSCDFTNLGLDSDAKNLIDGALWYLGAMSSASDLYADDYYNSERGTSVYSCSTSDGACPRSTNWTGKIGLFYASDYMYAADLSVCTKVGYNSLEENSDYSDEKCTENNWLNSGTVGKWTMTVSSSNGYHAFLSYATGEINVDNASTAFAYHPVVYLKSDVIMSGGSGTSFDPYILSDEKLTVGSLLSEAEAGDYVAYVGNNGCSEDHCDGLNANYVDDVDMGYCGDSTYKFSANGWRVAYVENGSAYLVSAGATDCMCTDSTGTASTTSCSSSLTTANSYLHVDNMNDLALDYCNTNYASGGVCNENTAWAMKDEDLQKIINSSLATCDTVSNFGWECGLTNDIIDNGGNYWFATKYSDSANTIFRWNVYYVGSNASENLLGVRSILYLDSSVYITGGSGTYYDPYTIASGTT